MDFKKLLVVTVTTVVGLATPTLAIPATYYSGSLAGRVMTNGVRYQPWLKIAAHPSLPLGKSITVVNKKTKKSVRVVVSDRCNCNLDLSLSAFKAVGGKTKDGIVHVYYY